LIAMFVLVVESLCSQHFFSNHTAGGTYLNRNKIILNEGSEASLALETSAGGLSKANTRLV
jgi:hypothetical protein